MILIKTKNEIDYIRESCQIVADTLKLVSTYAKVGVTTLELDKIAEDFIRSNNSIPAFKGYSQAGSIDFPGTLCTSVESEVVHGIPSNRVLVDGEVLSIDVGVIKNKYYGDSAVSIAIGEISDEKKQLMKVTEEALYKGIEASVEGNRFGDISYAIEEHVNQYGYGIVRELCGHGVGRYLHEDPQIPNFGKSNSGPKIKNGMTFAIEPMINLGTHAVRVEKDGWTVKTADNSTSAHFEHTVAIINGKPEILTSR
ncbi:MAG: type I methionyl aminopeptidase [Melioribacteraceae bacterium]|nr:type I methionyl aminopeptidase [Melioribacteraceae bacterium]MCF8264603.1 type I methionyl aminopeptidase [Melioribacteraceae bacterium]MCF8414450.1 type I methionyl aminopeptidase [Melioribacteraceae bacterium]